MYITGPQVIKTVTGQDVTGDELGNWEVHMSKSGNVHFAFDDEDGIANIRTTSVTDNLYYSLEGVRIGKPSKKGIYIHNGKKVVVR